MDGYNYLVISIVLASILLITTLLFISITRYVDYLKYSKIYKNKIMGFSDLLLYDCIIDDGIILNKNGSFSVAYEWKGIDFESSTNAEKNNILYFLNEGIKNLGDSFILNVDCIRTNNPSYFDNTKSSFPDDITKGIERERENLFKTSGVSYKNKTIFTITYFPPKLVEKKLIDAMYVNNKVNKTNEEVLKEILDNFKNMIKLFESSVSIISKLNRLGVEEFIDEDNQYIYHDNFLSWLNQCITGEEQKIIVPKNAYFPIDNLICSKEYHHGHIGKLGNKYVMVVAIQGVPNESYSGILNSLSELSCSYRWSTRFIALNNQQAISILGRIRTKWKQKEKGIINYILQRETENVDHFAVQMERETTDFISGISSNYVQAGYYTSVVVLMDEDKEVLEKNAINVHKFITSLGYNARIETNNTTEAFLGSFPGDCVANIRRNLMTSLQVSSLLPLSTIWTGSDKAPCPFYPEGSPPLMQCLTSTNVPFWLNLHVRDLGHTLIFGSTGSGKSVLLSFIVAQFRRYKNASIFFFDKGRSSEVLCKAVKGNYYSLGSNEDGKNLSLCPFQDMSTSNKISWLYQWMESILYLNNIDITPMQRESIATALNNMSNEQYRSMGAFKNIIQDMEIRQALTDYSDGGTLGDLIGGSNDNLSFSNFNVFELENLMSGSSDKLTDRKVLPVLLYIFRRIEESLDGRPSLIVLDEAWLMLKHPIFRDKIVEWLKVLRKANCAVVLATQSLTDAGNSGIFDVLTESTATKIFLPNMYAKDPVYSDYYYRLGLNSSQLDVITKAIPKKQYYVVSEQGSRLFELGLGKFTLAFIASSSKDNLKVVNDLINLYGDNWVSEWLKYNNIEYPK